MLAYAYAVENLECTVGPLVELSIDTLKDCKAYPVFVIDITVQK